MDRLEPRALDLLAAEAVASPVVASVSGWRCSLDPDGPFRRANAVLPGPTAGTDAEADRRALAAVRAWYAPRGQRLLVQVGGDGPRRERLDRFLADEGLGLEAPVTVLAGSLGEQPGGDGVVVQRGIDEAWAARHGGVGEHDSVQLRRACGYGRLFEAHGPDGLGAAVWRDGAAVGVGFGVVAAGWLGIFGMATDPAVRRQGVATRIVHALSRAAAERGARLAYLQVEEDNGPAMALYRMLGFELHHRYHYRSEGRAPQSEGC